MRPTATTAMLRACLLATLMLAAAAAPRAALAQAFTWLSPAGGEVWTAGTTHTMEWSGGPSGANLTVVLIRITPFQSAGTIQVSMPYGFTTPMTIPSNLPPGQYQMYVADTPTTTWAYSGIFTVQSAPACGQGCQAIAVAPEYFGGYPGTSCGTTLAIATANAQAWLAAKLNAACTTGWTIDPLSVVAEYTQVPLGSCYVGQSGFYQVEATAVACCCPPPTNTLRGTWGGLKAHYR